MSYAQEEFTLRTTDTNCVDDDTSSPTFRASKTPSGSKSSPSVIITKFSGYHLRQRSLGFRLLPPSVPCVASRPVSTSRASAESIVIKRKRTLKKSATCKARSQRGLLQSVEANHEWQACTLKAVRLDILGKKLRETSSAIIKSVPRRFSSR